MNHRWVQTGSGNRIKNVINLIHSHHYSRSTIIPLNDFFYIHSQRNFRNFSVRLSSKINTSL